MRDLLDKLKINQIWNIALYVEDEVFSFPSRVTGSPAAVFNSRKLRKAKRHLHTYADPFLFVDNGELWVFYESQAAHEQGKIEAIKTSDLMAFEPVGEILREPWHLSYPFVFRSGPSIYLIPESVDIFEVQLYRFDRFPHEPVKVRTLLKGHYKDSSVVEFGGLWYLFTASEDGLEIWITDDILSGELRPHRLNPITRHRKYFRCGGGPLFVGDQLFRVAQDGSAEYGKNISVMRIDDLSPDNYRETLIADEYFDLDQRWNARGGHHLSLVEFRNKRVIAVDGKQDDLIANKFLSILYSI